MHSNMSESALGAFSCAQHHLSFHSSHHLTTLPFVPHHTAHSITHLHLTLHCLSSLCVAICVVSSRTLLHSFASHCVFCFCHILFCHATICYQSINWCLSRGPLCSLLNIHYCLHLSRHTSLCVFSPCSPKPSFCPSLSLHSSLSLYTSPQSTGASYLSDDYLLGAKHKDWNKEESESEQDNDEDDDEEPDLSD